MGSLPLWKGATMRTIQIDTNQWSLQPCPVLCIVHFAATFAQKCDHLPLPSDPYISETAFSHRFQKVYTYPPPLQDEILAHWTKSSQNPVKVPKPTVLADNECPREILHIPALPWFHTQECVDAQGCITCNWLCLMQNFLLHPQQN